MWPPGSSDTSRVWAGASSAGLDQTRSVGSLAWATSSVSAPAVRRVAPSPSPDVAVPPAASEVTGVWISGSSDPQPHATSTTAIASESPLRRRDMAGQPTGWPIRRGTGWSPPVRDVPGGSGDGGSGGADSGELRRDYPPLPPPEPPERPGRSTL